MRFLSVIFGLIPAILTAQQDTSFTNYEMPVPVQLYNYSYESEEKPMNKKEEQLSIVGWSDEGKLAFVVEPPDENCGCYFFEARLMDLNTNKQEYLYHYSNADFVHGEKKMDSASTEINCEDMQCAWFSNYQELAGVFHAMKIKQETKGVYYPEKHFKYSSSALDHSTGVNDGMVKIWLVREEGDDTLTYSYGLRDEDKIKEVDIAGALDNPFKRGQSVLIVSETREGLNPETDEVVTYKLIGLSRKIAPSMVPVVMEKPPFDRYLSSGVKRNVPFRHVELMEEKHDKIGALADEEWFSEYGDYIRAWAYGDGAMTEVLKSYYVPHGQPEVIYKDQTPFHLAMAIEDGNRAFYLYGKPPNRFNVILDPTQLIVYNIDSAEVEKWYDFSNYSYRDNTEEDEQDFILQKINWVQEEDSVLYVSHSHNTYAGSSNGKNAYITAIDLKTDEILWRSKPLVSNSINFEIINDVIISGYGFTAEPDYIYLMNRKNGEVIDRIQVSSAPDWFSYDGDRIYVRTYDGSYQFEIQSSFFESY